MTSVSAIDPPWSGSLYVAAAVVLAADVRPLTDRSNWSSIPLNGPAAIAGGRTPLTS